MLNSKNGGRLLIKARWSKKVERPSMVYAHFGGLFINDDIVFQTRWHCPPPPVVPSDTGVNINLGG